MPSDLRAVSFLQEIRHRIDRFFNPVGVLVRASIVHESARFHGGIDGAPVSGKIELLGVFFRRLHEQVLPETVVLHSMAHEHVHQSV
jgi:hypothetical protein